MSIALFSTHLGADEQPSSVEIKNVTKALLALKKLKSHNKADLALDKQIERILSKIPGTNQKFRLVQLIPFENDVEDFFSLGLDEKASKEIMNHSTFMINGEEICGNKEKPVAIHNGSFTFGWKLSLAALAAIYLSGLPQWLLNKFPSVILEYPCCFDESHISNESHELSQFMYKQPELYPVFQGRIWDILKLVCKKISWSSLSEFKLHLSKLTLAK